MKLVDYKGNPYEFSGAAYKLIRSHEGTDQPWRWPHEDSGVTIGIGEDLGYMTRALYVKHWGWALDPKVLERLGQAIGVKGMAAEELCEQFRDITIPLDLAVQVFDRYTLPEYIAETKAVWPGVERLPMDAFGALVSCVYNRGGKLNGPRRVEMLTIRGLVPKKDLAGIAAALRSMKRLWPHNKGLRQRRDDEAALVERAQAKQAPA